MNYIRNIILWAVIGLLLALLLVRQDRSFSYSMEAERVYSLYVQLTDYHTLYKMGYPVDKLEAYGTYMDLNNACLLYKGVDYNLSSCIRTASLEINGY